MFPGASCGRKRETDSQAWYLLRSEEAIREPTTAPSPHLAVASDECGAKRQGFRSEPDSEVTGQGLSL